MNIALQEPLPVPTPVVAPSAGDRLTWNGPLSLIHGGELQSVEIAYSDVGPEDAPVMVVMGGISANRDVSGEEGWWSELVGPGRVIDTRNCRVIGFDWLGGWGDSTRADGPEFPVVDTRDQAVVLAGLLDHLGIERVRTVIGSSYGGLVAQQFAALFPLRAERLLVLGAGHQPHPLATALRCVQRRILRDGARAGRLAEATALARSLAMTTYRSSREFGHRFGSEPEIGTEGGRFAVEDYLDHCGNRFAERFGGWAYLRLSESIDLHRVQPERLQPPIDLVAFTGDQIAPPEQLREFKLRKGRDCRLWVIDSDFGHDGFLKETACLRPILSRVIEEVSPC